MVVSLWWVTYPSGKRKSGLILWVTYLGGGMASFFGWPTHVKKNRWRMVSFFGWPTQKKWWSHCNGWPTQMEKIWWSGLVVMGDLPKYKECELRSHCNGWPTQKNVGEGSKAHSKWGRVRKRTTREVRAQRRTQNEVGLENALPERWGLKSALGMR